MALSMMEKKRFDTVCVCGGGALGHVVAGYLSAVGKMNVNLLTGKPQLWNRQITINSCDGRVLNGRLGNVSSSPVEVIPGANLIILCLPGFLIRDELIRIRPYLSEDAYVGGIVSSTGFFYSAMEVLPSCQPVWGFQRVPFICRVDEYGKSANLLGYKSRYDIAVENVDEVRKREFAGLVEEMFGRPTHLLKNYLEASLTNSNPLLHTSRLYSMFSDWDGLTPYNHNILFYEEWTDAASELLISMDEEFFRLLDVLPVTKGFIPRLTDYYESNDARALTRKLSGISGFKGITSPMRGTEGGWVPDFRHRYFVEDFPYGLRFIRELGHRHGTAMPCIDMVYEWGVKKIAEAEKKTPYYNH